jgi:hypothetical protein
MLGTVELSLSDDVTIAFTKNGNFYQVFAASDFASRSPTFCVLGSSPTSHAATPPALHSPPPHSYKIREVRDG